MTLSQLIAKFGEQHVVGFFCVLARISPLFLVAPLFSSKLLPARSRGVVAVGLAIGLAPLALHGVGGGHAVPTDPIDGKPLRFRRLADGVVIHSVGQDGRDPGGGIAHDRTPVGQDDRAFHLWDVLRRHHPVKPSQRTVGDEAAGNR